MLMYKGAEEIVNETKIDMLAMTEMFKENYSKKRKLSNGKKDKLITYFSLSKQKGLYKIRSTYADIFGHPPSDL